MLGEVLHGTFENYASDENLPAGHWFWDCGKSGGIFIEHGVHGAALPGDGARGTADFRTSERHGVIFCPENKDVVLFPEAIGGALAALHRSVCGTPFARPEK